MFKIKCITFFMAAAIMLLACIKDDDNTKVPVTIDETPYVLEYGALPTPDLPADNPLTVNSTESEPGAGYDSPPKYV